MNLRSAYRVVTNVNWIVYPSTSNSVVLLKRLKSLSIWDGNRWDKNCRKREESSNMYEQGLLSEISLWKYA
jgi:DNA-binding transcriptional regulator/RsmH inhibitor MraZ